MVLCAYPDACGDYTLGITGSMDVDGKVKLIQYLMHPLIFSLYYTKDSSIASLLHQHLPEALHQRT